MNTHPNKWIVRWNIVLTTLMLISLAMNAVWVQAANDPPVTVFTASADDVGGGGFYRTSDVAITGTSATTLLSVSTANLSAAHSHICLVTASAQAARTNNAAGLYTFGLNMDTANSLASGSGRYVQFLATTDEDKTQEAVSTVRYFRDVSGGHTFYLLAQKAAVGAADMTVTSASMVVACFKKELRLPI